MAEISVTCASERYRNYTFCESGKHILLVKEGQVIDSYYCIRTIVSDEDYLLQLQRDTSLVIQREELERHRKPKYTPLKAPLVHKFNLRLLTDQTSTARKDLIVGGI